jgi:4-amino-4-deoxy-L-arabinose transferase-like glycosyltransferase
VSTPSISLPRLARVRERARARAIPRPRPELIGLLALAGVLNLWALGQNGFANTYYSGAVRAMSSSWHAFLFGSFDASGAMTVDKPPLALWVQALSVKVFGFSSWAILVPQALMGVATVWLVYDLVQRRFGRAGGFAAGLALALTPMAVAISRHNNPDALLVLCSVAALWFLVRALEDGRMRWLVLCGVAVGLGFEAKMAVALMVVPGIAAAYLWVAPKGRLAAVKALAAGGAAMIAVGGAWPVLMWLTPASDRPWISGTSDNSIWSLIFGYNGLGRLFGQDGGPGGGAGGPGGGGPGGNGGPFGGSTGPLRLLNESMGAQAGWLLGGALVIGAGLVVMTRLRRTDARTGWLIAVGGAFAVTVVAFSRAEGIFHPYYVSFLAPFTAALVGAGVGEIVRGGRAARILGPAAIAGAMVTEVYVLRNDTDLGWLVPVVLAVGGFAAIALAGGVGPRLTKATLVAVAVVLLAAPAAWSFQTLGHATNGTFPAGGPVSAGFGGPGGPGGGGRAMRGGPPAGAGPAVGRAFPGAPPSGAAPAGGAFPGAPSAAAGAGRFGGGGPFGGNQNLTQAAAYAKTHGGGTIAVSSQQGASNAVMRGIDVVAIGGFSGRESQVSTAWLAQRVASGEIRWVLTDGSGGGGMRQDARVGSRDVMADVQQTCKPVSSVSGLYDCSGSAAALQGASS